MSLLADLKKVTTFIFDMDGVLTDGTLMILDNGQFIRRMNIKDGYALQLAVKKGYRVAVISGSTSDPAVIRLGKLGITDVFMGVKNKTEVFNQYLQQHQTDASQILYMGDDIPDLAVMKLAGMPCAPADAVNEIKQVARYISTASGGMGCVRDVIEKVMKLNDHWDLHTDVASK
ncbi:HAD hydrolase family protein [Pseudoflavitalea sp. G-6-1-2]|uniref:KdsC family phosphatase n=1 Tax=Pseudoflavitalea sp. G-6-1-2 TaxID=2728841 RepID=UPI00146DC85D|nr:HAD hydrolase-like protein [Pseudoflavitalea sp. G-6-1-2]NML21521.1 HAD hydrolase family protein [Pseudoflavitalea sp. G-6-1-2]